jgi:oxygen-independent coproporphyrinogen III oxidase
MAGIYIHIPYCRQKCHYCNFFSVASLKSREKLIDALILEIALQKDYLDNEVIETIYFGGGTPSLLKTDEMTKIIDRLSKHHNIIQSPEITLEANPDDLSRDKITALRKTPINRLSIGVQSFFDQDLKYLNRIHSADEALMSVKTATDRGYNNLSIDLIYGIPTLTDENWLQNLDTFFTLNLQHLSAYALTVEPKTALDLLINRSKLKPVEEDAIVSHFNLLMKSMTENGYTQYEISNFCMEPLFSKHNMSYWLGKKYLGIGPSAHSFNGISRQWNVSSINQYISSVEKQILPSTIEVLSEDQLFNEYILTSLRTMWGTDLDIIESRFGKYYSTHFLTNIAKSLSDKKVMVQGKKYYLSNNGKLFADRVASELFI